MSAYELDPFSVSVGDKLALLSDWSERLLASPVIDHVDASLVQVRECKFYADGATTAVAAAGAAAPGAHRGRGGAQRPVRDHAHAGPARRPGL